MAGEGWHSLWVPDREARQVADALRTALEAAGYRSYDPFPGGGGLSFGWKVRARHFVAPAAAGWTRVLGVPDTAVLPVLCVALETALLYAWLVGEAWELTAWTPAGEERGAEALAAWLRPGRSTDDLRRAMAGQMPVPAVDAGPQVMAVPLPPDVAAMAESVDARQAEKMMARLSKSVFGKLGGQGDSAQADARAMLAGAVDWNGEHGRRLRAAVACLTIPEGWRSPTYAELADAYQVARARRQSPGGAGLPGDDAALARVPDALDYLPVYAGKR